MTAEALTVKTDDGLAVKTLRVQTNSDAQTSPRTTADATTLSDLVLHRDRAEDVRCERCSLTFTPHPLKRFRTLEDSLTFLHSLGETNWTSVESLKKAPRRDRLGVIPDDLRDPCKLCALYLWRKYQEKMNPQPIYLHVDRYDRIEKLQKMMPSQRELKEREVECTRLEAAAEEVRQLEARAASARRFIERLRSITAGVANRMMIGEETRVDRSLVEQLYHAASSLTDRLGPMINAVRLGECPATSVNEAGPDRARELAAAITRVVESGAADEAVIFSILRRFRVFKEVR